MGFIKKLFSRFTTEYEDFSEDDEASDWETVVYSRADIDIHNREERMEYVQSCLEQIADCVKELDSLNFEYNTVTSNLKDMEEIEALKDSERKELEVAASKVSLLQNEKETYQKRSGKMTDAQFMKMEHLSDEAEAGYQKILEAEDYQNLVRTDLSRLDAERSAFKYRRSELLGILRDLRTIAVVCTGAFVICFILLLGLQFGLEMDTAWGFILTATLAAVVYVLIYFKFHDSKIELKRLERDTNRLILLQNKVKIRYVNNTNLLSYLYIKYNVTSGKELKKLWEAYQEEKEARDAFRKAQFELDENEKALMDVLHKHRIKDPTIWLHQTDAILDRKEMVEIRHNLIIRRQSLRRRMDYNKDTVAANAQKEIRELVESYPQYASEIMRMVERYERNFK